MAKSHPQLADTFFNIARVHHEQSQLEDAKICMRNL